MRESAILNHAARVLDSLPPGAPADAALRRYLEGPRLGAAEKRAVSQAVFANFRWLGWLDQASSTQKRVEQALELQERFDADPSSVKAEALAARAVPGWLASEMEPGPEYLRQLQRPPALWIRGRPGKASGLAAALGGCEPPDLSAHLAAPADLAALRYRGESDLFLTPQFRSGEFEIQDLSSQLVGHACAPVAGETWWDACAGEGGKTLHLSDLMRNKGMIWATDRSARRLAVLRRRAARAGAFNYRVSEWGGGAPPLLARFDGVLLDAPCSGVGTWQRNPHARWTVTPRDVAELAGIQLRLLRSAAAALKPGGRLVYSVCTLTRSETVAVAKAFAADHPGFVPIPLPIAPAGTEAGQLTLWPQEINANGMFIACWKRPL